MDKTGTDFHASHALKVKTGTLPPDHADAQSDQTGTEPPVSAVMEEDNGTLSQDHVNAHQATGTDSHASFAPPVKPGIQTVFHVHAQPALTGTVLNAEPAQARTDTGTINSMTVSAEPETGTEPAASFVPPTPTGTEELASLATEEEFGTQST